LEKSYEAVSISDISCAIGLTKGALYHHFVNKEELFKAVIDKYLDLAPIEVSNENISLLEFNELCINHQEKMLRKLFSNSSEFIPIDYVALIAACFRHYKGFSDEKLAMIDMELKKIKKIMDNAVLKKEIKENIDTEIIAQLFFSSMIAMAGPFLQRMPIHEIIDLLKSQLDEFYKLLKA
jgi:AcrR family transcriptional regulator